MADHEGSVEIDEARRGPAWVLLISGLGAIAVSVGVGFGLLPTVIGVVTDSPVDGRWWLVVVAVVVGLALVVPRRRR